MFNLTMPLILFTGFPLGGRKTTFHETKPGANRKGTGSVKVWYEQLKIMA